MSWFSLVCPYTHKSPAVTMSIKSNYEKNPSWKPKTWQTCPGCTYDNDRKCHASDCDFYSHPERFKSGVRVPPAPPSVVESFGSVCVEHFKCAGCDKSITGYHPFRGSKYCGVCYAGLAFGGAFAPQPKSLPVDKPTYYAPTNSEGEYSAGDVAIANATGANLRTSAPKRDAEPLPVPPPPVVPGLTLQWRYDNSASLGRESLIDMKRLPATRCSIYCASNYHKTHALTCACYVTNFPNAPKVGSPISNFL